MARHRLDSINDFARQGYAVRVTCIGCGNFSDWNPVLLMDELHRRRGLAIEAVERSLKCSACGKREATITPVLPEQ